MEETNEILNPLEYCPQIVDPEPYIPSNNFSSHNDLIESNDLNVLNDIILQPELEKTLELNIILASWFISKNKIETNKKKLKNRFERLII